MGRRTFSGRAIISAGIITLISFYARAVSAETIYGCPQSAMVMLDRPGKCPDGAEPSVVKEGYIRDDDKVILDTFSNSEKEEFGLSEDSKFVVVIYRSFRGGEASFSEEGISGKGLKRDLVELKYGRGNTLSAAPLSSAYKLLPQYDKDVIKNKISRHIEESKPKFYQQHRDQGMTDEEIGPLWESIKEVLRAEYQQALDSGDYERVRKINK